MSTTPTKRDYIWDATLRALRESETEYITQDDVMDRLRGDVAPSTVNFAMWALCDLGYLTHEKESTRWYPGPNAPVRGG